MRLGKKYSRKVSAWEIDRVVEQYADPQPVTTRQATAEEMARTGRTEYVDYEDDNYNRKYDNRWLEFERKMYNNVR